MARIEIEDPTVHHKPITFARNSQVKNIDIYYQDAWIHLSKNKYPFKYQLNVGAPDKGYAVGSYDVDLEACFKVDEYGRMNFSDRDMVLIPSKAVNKVA